MMSLVNLPDPNPKLGSFYGLFTDPLNHDIFLQKQLHRELKVKYFVDGFGSIKM